MLRASFVTVFNFPTHESEPVVVKLLTRYFELFHEYAQKFNILRCVRILVDQLGREGLLFSFIPISASRKRNKSDMVSKRLVAESACKSCWRSTGLKEIA